MDITNILNTKGGAAAAAAAAAAAHPEQQLHQQLAQATDHGRTTSMSDSERAGSPQHHELSGRYSSRPPQALHVVSSLQDGLHYPSPSQLHAPLPMLQTGMVQTNGYDNGYGHDGMRGGGRPMESPSQKAFPCSTCGKGFARRSDLARHGKSPQPVDAQCIQEKILIISQNGSTLEYDPMCANTPGATSNSSSGLP
jgi:hypothetical protein